MSIQQNKAIKLEEWMLWGRWKETFLGGSYWNGFGESEIFKELELEKSIKGDLINYDGYFLGLNSDLEEFSKIVIKYLEKDTPFFSKAFKNIDQSLDNFLKMEKEINIEKFMIGLKELAGCSMIMHLSDRSSEEYIKEKCKQEKISYEEFIAQIHPKKESPLMQYNSRLKKLKESEFEDFLKEFAWVGTSSFAGSPLNIEKLKLDIEAAKKNKPHEIKKIKLNKEMQKIVDLGCNLTYYRSTIYETMLKVSIRYRRPLEDLAKKNNLNFRDITNMTFSEVIELYKRGKIPKDIKQRKDKLGLETINKNWTIIQGKELDEKINLILKSQYKETTEVKGAIAFKGKVKGIAKIIQEVKDCSKIKEGDIIIAPETVPDYILAMRKAAAFVTNQGGITSHASIVARELKKPCIIGTKIATLIFKDGDLIEVDAEKGIVKKI